MTAMLFDDTAGAFKCASRRPSQPSTARPQLPELAAYYEHKTASILARYGPGPKVHYHTGLIDKPPRPEMPVTALRQMLTASQERMLSHAAEAWNARETLCGELLDVGCGLGGGSIFWAQECGARVTAVTCVSSHVEWVSRFAAEARVAARVRPRLYDAVELPGYDCFDAAVAVDSSGYLPRGPWMDRVAGLLRRGGRLFIIDCFLARPEYEEPFNRHWYTRIGTLNEYVDAAREAGLRLESLVDVSHGTEHFWTITIALMEASISAGRTPLREKSYLSESLRMHRLVRQGLATGGLRYALLTFCK